MNPTPRLADHLTPFIRNEWYVAAESAEIGRSFPLIERPPFIWIWTASLPGAPPKRRAELRRRGYMPMPSRECAPVKYFSPALLAAGAPPLARRRGKRRSALPS
jgi:hypothetical protein